MIILQSLGDSSWISHPILPITNYPIHGHGQASKLLMPSMFRVLLIPATLVASLALGAFVMLLFGNDRSLRIGAFPEGFWQQGLEQYHRKDDPWSSPASVAVAFSWSRSSEHRDSLWWGPYFQLLSGFILRDYRYTSTFHGDSCGYAGRDDLGSDSRIPESDHRARNWLWQLSWIMLLHFWRLDGLCWGTQGQTPAPSGIPPRAISETRTFCIRHKFPGSSDTLPIFGVLLAFLAVLIIWWLIYKTTIGFEIRTVGQNPKLPYADRVEKTVVLTIAIAGGLAGLQEAWNAGLNHKFAPEFGGQVGFDGITALLGQAIPSGWFSPRFF